MEPKENLHEKGKNCYVLQLNSNFAELSKQKWTENYFKATPSKKSKCSHKKLMKPIIKVQNFNGT